MQHCKLLHLPYCSLEWHSRVVSTHDKNNYFSTFRHDDCRHHYMAADCSKHYYNTNISSRYIILSVQWYESSNKMVHLHIFGLNIIKNGSSDTCSLIASCLAALMDHREQHIQNHPQPLTFTICLREIECYPVRKGQNHERSCCNLGSSEGLDRCIFCHTYQCY